MRELYCWEFLLVQLQKKKRVFACGEAASQTEVPVRRSRAGTESDHNYEYSYANTTSFKLWVHFSAIIITYSCTVQQ